MESITVSEPAQLVGLLLGALVFITLIVVDIGKAVKKGGFWVPGHFLVLSALTIQLLSFVEDRSALLNRVLLNQNSNSTDVQNWNFTEVAEVNFMNCTEVAEVNFMNCTEVISKVNLMNFIQVHSALLDQKSKIPMGLRSNETDEVNEALFKDALFMVHCSRVMLCVLIAFFLPGMVRPGYENAWTTIAALGFAVFLHIFFELLSVRQNLKHDLRFFPHTLYFSTFDKDYNVNRVWVIVYGAIITVSLVWLILLLVCATIANKGIRNVTLQRIPLILTNPTESSWKALEDQVLKSWIVARACYPDSIIASSALASSAALAVTVCIVLSIVSWILQRPYTMIVPDTRFWLKFIITIVEILFILIGGTVIGWRWLTSVAYYGRWRRKSEWRKYFEVEEYWTQWIVELQKPQECPRLKRLPDDVDKNVNIIGREIKMPKVPPLLLKCVPPLLLKCVFWLQWLVVFSSNVNCLLSKLAFTNKVLHNMATKILSKHLGKVNPEFNAYKDLLNNVNVLQETPRSVFLKNRKSIKQAKTVMARGNEDGEKCSALISFLQHRSLGRVVGIQCLDPGTARDQLELKFLWKRNPQSTLDVKSYFVYPSKRSWKLTAVALINIISRLGGNSCEVDANCSCGKDNFKVYQEAWELMDLVEESDPETDSLLSKAADKKFMTLIREQRAQVAEKPPAPLTTMEEADAAIKSLAEVSRKESEINDNGQDTSVDWEKVVAGITVNNMCMCMDCSSGNFTELVNELQSTLADIIRACIEKVGVALVEESRKWAQEMEERKLLEAVYIAGKAKGLMAKLEWDPKLHIAPFGSAG